MTSLQKVSVTRMGGAQPPSSRNTYVSERLNAGCFATPMIEAGTLTPRPQRVETATPSPVSRFPVPRRCTGGAGGLRATMRSVACQTGPARRGIFEPMERSGSQAESFLEAVIRSPVFALRFRSEGTFKGELMGCPPTDERISIAGPVIP